MSDQFVTPGSLAPPGVIGRLVRIVLGGLVLYGLYLTVMGFAYFSTVGVPFDIPFLLGAAFCLYAIEDVVNIGYSVTWGGRLRAALLILSAIAAVLSWQGSGGPMGVELALVLVSAMVFVLAQLGPSFLLAGILGVPG